MLISTSGHSYELQPSNLLFQSHEIGELQGCGRGPRHSRKRAVRAPHGPQPNGSHPCNAVTRTMASVKCSPWPSVLLLQDCCPRLSQLLFCDLLHHVSNRHDSWHGMHQEDQISLLLELSLMVSANNLATSLLRGEDRVLSVIWELLNPNITTDSHSTVLLEHHLLRLHPSIFFHFLCLMLYFS